MGFNLSLNALNVPSGYQLHIFDGETGEPLIGATIVSESGLYQDITDLDGNSEMPNLNFRDIITISYIGYETLNLPVYEIRKLQGRIALFPDAMTFEEVVVIGRADKKIEEIPYVVSRIKSEEIQFKNSQTAADALSAHSEIYLQKSQLGGGSPVIRGFEANKVLLVLDGVRMNNAIYRNGHLQNAITVDNSVMDQIEVIYGPGSLIYGSDALGGVVHFRTKDPQLLFGQNESPNKVNTNVYGRFSSANLEKTFHFDMNFGMRKFGSLTAVTYSSFDDLKSGSKRTEGNPDWGLRQFFFQRIGGIDQIIENTDPTIQAGSAYGQLDILQKFRYQPNDNFYVIANFQYSANSDIPRYDRLTDTLSSASKLKFAEWEYGQQRLMGSLKARLLKPTWLYDNGTIIYAYQRADEDRFQRKFGNLRRSFQLEEVHINSLTLDFEKALNSSGSNQLTFGVDVNRNSVTSIAGNKNIISQGISGGQLTRYPSGGSSMDQIGAYMDYRWRSQDSLINVRAGLRYSNVTLDVLYTDSDIIIWPAEYYTGITSSNDNLSYAAAITYNSRNKLQARLIYSSAFRSPNIDDFAKIREKNGYVTVPNPRLKPELSPMNLELTIAKEFGNIKTGTPGAGLKLSGTSFYTALDDAIVRQNFVLPDGSTTLSLDDEQLTVQANVNALKAYIMGLSGNLLAKFDENWSAQASYNWIQGEAERSEGENAPLAHIPPKYGGIAITYQKAPWRFEGNIRFNAEKPIEDYALGESDNESEALPTGTPAWTTFNFYSKYQLNDQISFNFGVENIGDIHYRPFSSGISAAGRNFIISMRGAF
ncbi:MAG: TonB-dependent receptor [Bacteroidia bacterium]|nr:TonB-dependent receptor [Bacteroidia bacterium]